MMQSSVFVKKKINALKEQVSSDIKWGEGTGRCLPPFEPWNLWTDSQDVQEYQTWNGYSLPAVEQEGGSKTIHFLSWERTFLTGHKLSICEGILWNCNCFSVGYQWVKELQKNALRIFGWVRPKAFHDISLHWPKINA